MLSMILPIISFIFEMPLSDPCSLLTRLNSHFCPFSFPFLLSSFLSYVFLSFNFLFLPFHLLTFTLLPLSLIPFLCSFLPFFSFSFYSLLFLSLSFDIFYSDKDAHYASTVCIPRRYRVFDIHVPEIHLSGGRL